MAGFNFWHGAISGHIHGGQSLTHARSSEPPSHAVLIAVTRFFKSRTANHTLQVERDSTSTSMALGKSIIKGNP